MKATTKLWGLLPIALIATACSPSPLSSLGKPDSQTARRAAEARLSGSFGWLLEEKAAVIRDVFRTHYIRSYDFDMNEPVFILTYSLLSLGGMPPIEFRVPKDPNSGIDRAEVIVTAGSGTIISAEGYSSREEPPGSKEFQTTIAVLEPFHLKPGDQFSIKGLSIEGTVAELRASSITSPDQETARTKSVFIATSSIQAGRFVFSDALREHYSGEEASASSPVGNPFFFMVSIGTNSLFLDVGR